MIEEKEVTPVGKFQKTHALKGELNALLDINEDFFDENNPLVLEVEGIFVPFYLESIRRKGSSSFLIKLKGIESEEEAKSFVNKEIYALKDTLKTFLEEEGEELMDSDSLIGYVIEDENSGVSLGEIFEIDDTTSNLLFLIKNSLEEIIYIPVVDEWITEVDNENKKLIMNFPEGLIDLNKKTEKGN